MYSPFEAVYGHDRTFVQRMTTAEYLQELEEEEKELRGEACEREDVVGNDCQGKQKPRQYELRRAALTSRDPLVSFSSMFPMYDRLGRELCVMYQVHEWDIQQERDRLRRGGEEQQCRRSGVRLSNELPADSLPSRLLSVSGKGTSMIHDKAAAPTVEGEDAVDVSVSAMSRNSSYPRTHSVSARPSEFSIYRDSIKPSALVATVRSNSGAGGDRMIGGPAPNLSRSAVVASSPTKDKNVVPLDSHSDLNGLSRWPRMRKLSEEPPLQRTQHAMGGKRARSASRLGCGLNFESDEMRPDGQPTVLRQQRSSAAATPPPPSSTARQGGALRGLPNDPSAGDFATVIPSSYDPIRLTTVRDSVVPRITTQLFRPTVGSAPVGARGAKTTSSLAPAQLIPSTAYGLQASMIAACKVHATIEDNYQRVTASYHCLKSFPDTPTPELRCGAVLQLDHRWFQLRSLLVAAEVYEVVEVCPPRCKQGETEGKWEGALPGPPSPLSDREAVISAKTLPTTVNDSEAGAAGSPKEKTLAQEGRAASLVAGSKATEKACPPMINTSDVVCFPVRPDGPQTLLYHWRTHYLSFKGKESRRAALGLALAAPEVTVEGFDFADGGLTLLTIPPGYHAVPMSGLPLSAASYVTLLKTVLRLLSYMVARRIVHGNLASLGELLLVHPVEEAEVLKEGALGANGLAALPLVVPVHWERSLDFSMFVDRNAGRTIPYDTEDGSDQPLLTYGRDLATVLSCFLEHKLSGELNSEQYVLLQRLIIMAGEPTQVGNFLVQIKNMMSTLSTDLVALRQAHKAAVLFYNRDA